MATHIAANQGSITTTLQHATAVALVPDTCVVHAFVLQMLSAHVLTEKYTSADLDQYALAPTLGADSYLYITR